MRTGTKSYAMNSTRGCRKYLEKMLHLGSYRVSYMLMLFSSLALMISCNSSAPELTFSLVSLSESGGLGLTRDTWNSQFGPPINPTEDWAFYQVSWDRQASVLFTKATPVSPKLVESIDIRVPDQSVSFDDARRVALSLIPNDAISVRTSKQQIKDGREILSEHLSSKSLRRLYQAICDDRSDLRIGPEETLVSYTLEKSTGNVARVTVYWNCPQH